MVLLPAPIKALSLIVLLAIAASLAAGEEHSAVVSPGQLAQGEPDRLITYKQTGQGDLQLHVFQPAGHQADDRRSAIVFFFGGGWVGGSPKQFYPHCRYLARRGMVAISAEYRVKNRHGTSPYECVMDGKSTIRYVRQHAAELGIDANRIAAGGGSAGGHVAAATGTLTAFDEPDEDHTISSRPDALVLFNPVFDNGPGEYSNERVKERWREFSPAHNIRPGTPPTIVFLGDTDRLIPVETARRYDETMRQAGNRSELYLYEGQPHGFFNFGVANHRYFIETVRAADAFLESLGFLDGPPALAPFVQNDERVSP